MDIKKSYPFCDCSDEYINEHIELAISEMKKMFMERDFEDPSIWLMGRALVHLEQEKKQREMKH